MEQNLYIVEIANFGDGGRMSPFSFGNQTIIYVVAKNYGEAVEKATYRLAELSAESVCKSNNSILDEDGSIKQHFLGEKKEPKIVGVKLIEDIIIW